MICAKCDILIPNGEDREHNNKVLCEDCYMDGISAPKLCNPWATFNAKTYTSNHTNGTLNDNQKKIINVLKVTGAAEPSALIESLGEQISSEVSKRECTILRRMGRISIKHTDGIVRISLKNL